MRPGEVYRFSYLWGHEAGRGEESGRKIRRVCLILQHAGHLYLFPLTSKRPVRGADGPARVFVTVPEAECLRIGLPPGSVSHLVLDDFNKVRQDQLYDFETLSPVGSLSAQFLAQVARIFLAAVQAGRPGGRTRR